MPSSVRVASGDHVGRGQELRAVELAVQRQPPGRPGVVLVSGPAGIGKTRFVEEVSGRLGADRTRVMTGRCLDVAGGAASYSALISALRSVDPPAVQLLDGLTGAAEMPRSRLFELLRTTFTTLAIRRPTVLVVEDLHWADRVTRDALLYLHAMVTEGRLVLLSTYRDDETAERPGLRELLGGLAAGRVTRVRLEPLSVEEVATQVAALRGAPPADEDAPRMHRRSGGVPLLVEELVAAEASGERGVPGHLRDLFLARASTLDEHARPLVDVVAVTGTVCPGEVAEHALRLGPAEATSALDRACEAGVLVGEPKGYRMRHELFREAVYSAVPPGRRRELHAAVARALADVRPRDPVGIAHHWYESGDREQAAAACWDAAGAAERVHSTAMVHTQLERVLELFDALSPDAVERIGGRPALLLGAADAAYLSGDFGRAAALAEEAVGCAAEGTPVPAVRWERLARYRYVVGDGPGTRVAHERSVQELTDGDPAGARVAVLAGYAWHLAMTNQFEPAAELADAALAAADAGDPVARCRALLASGLNLGQQGLAGADDQLREALRLATDADLPDELARGHAALSLSMERQGVLAGREQVLRDGLRHARAHGLTHGFVLAFGYLLAELLLELGQWDESEELLESNLTHGVSGVPALFTRAYRAHLGALRADWSVTDEHAETVLALSERLPQQVVPRTVALLALAEACLWRGELGPARKHVESALPSVGHPLVGGQVAAMAARVAADLAEEDRRRGRPPAWEPALPAHAHQASGAEDPQTDAYSRMTRAELTRAAGQRDPEVWRTAADAWEALGVVYRDAYCRWRLAHALLGSRSQRPEAARALAAAHQRAESLRAGPLLAAVRSLATTARIQVGDGSGAGTAARTAVELGLTARELEIVPLLVAGRTNAEIGEVLVISPRTVGVHVSRILGKLGAARRTEAAELARQRGIVE